MGIKFIIERLLFIFFPNGPSSIRQRNADALRLLEKAYVIIGHGIWNQFEDSDDIRPFARKIRSCHDQIKVIQSLEEEKEKEEEEPAHSPSFALRSNIDSIKDEIKEVQKRKEEVLFSFGIYDPQTQLTQFNEAKEEFEKLRTEEADLNDELSILNIEYIKLNKQKIVALTKGQKLKRLITTSQENYFSIGKYVYHNSRMSGPLVTFLEKNRKLRKQLRKIDKSISYNQKLADSFMIELDR